MNSKRQAPEKTAKLHFSLDDAGVPIAATLLYGLLEALGESQGWCSPTHSELAGMLPQQSRQIRRLLNLLRRLKLVEWDRTGRANRYRVMRPDLRHIGNVMRGERP